MTADLGNRHVSDEELIIAVRANGMLEITSAATADERLHPLFDCEFGPTGGSFSSREGE